MERLLAVRLVGRVGQRTSATISRSWGWWDRLVRSTRSARSAWRRSGRLARWPASRWLRSARRMIAQARWWAGGRDSRRTARRPRWRPRWRPAPRGGPTGTARETQGRVARGRNPRAPPERSVTVSRHSAPAILIIRGFLTHAQWAKSLGYCLVTRSQDARAFFWARNRLYFLRIHRTR